MKYELSRVFYICKSFVCLIKIIMHNLLFLKTWVRVLVCTMQKPNQSFITLRVKKILHDANSLRIMAKYCSKNIWSSSKMDMYISRTTRWMWRSFGAIAVGLHCTKIGSLVLSESTWSTEMKWLSWEIKISNLKLNGLRPVWVTAFYAWIVNCASCLQDKNLFI